MERRGRISFGLGRTAETDEILPEMARRKTTTRAKPSNDAVCASAKESVI